MSDQPKKLALYPVYLYEDGFELPKTGKYYLVTSKGIYFHKETKVGTGLVKVDGIPWLEPVTAAMTLGLPKITGDIIATALTFFRKVFQVHRSEAYVTLMYSTKLAKYRLWCPQQTVSAGSVNYDRTDQPSFQDRTENDWQMVGTIHSHCDFSAFHSGTDTFDESTFDGIHITLGHVNRSQFSMVASVAFNNQREQMEPENCVLGVARVGNKTVSSSKHMTWGDANYFELELSEAEAQELVAATQMIDGEWMPKVQHGWKGGVSQTGTGFQQADGKKSGGSWWDVLGFGKRAGDEYLG